MFLPIMYVITLFIIDKFYIYSNLVRVNYIITLYLKESIYLCIERRKDEKIENKKVLNMINNIW